MKYDYISLIRILFVLDFIIMELRILILNARINVSKSLPKCT